MTKAPDQGWRRARLAALVEHEDFRGRAPLGRALGYKDGAYVRQMIEGERAISEKTITAIETMRGSRFKGWFDKPELGDGLHFSVIDHDAGQAPGPDPSAPPPPPPPNFADRRVASDSDWALIDALKWLPEDERLALIQEVTAKAEKMRAYVLEHLEKVNGRAKGEVDPERK